MKEFKGEDVTLTINGQPVDGFAKTAKVVRNVNWGAVSTKFHYIRTALNTFWLVELFVTKHHLPMCGASYTKPTKRQVRKMRRKARKHSGFMKH